MARGLATALSHQPIPRGAELSCKGWRQEAVFRVLLERSQRGPVQEGDVGSMLAVLPSIAPDQTLAARGGKPPLVLLSDESAPRVIQLSRASTDTDLALSFWLARGAGWMAAGSQDVLCAAFVTLAHAARKHFGGDLAGKLVVSGGLGETGAAISLAAAMNGAGFLGIEADERAIQGRIRSGFCDICVNDLDEALRILKFEIRRQRPVSVGLAGKCEEILPEMARRGVVPDLLTDATGSKSGAEESRARHMAAILELQRLGSVVFEFGDGVITAARRAGSEQAAAIPGFVSAFLEPVTRAAAAPMRWFALSGEGSNLLKLDDALASLVSENDILGTWLRRVKQCLRQEGIPARVAWLTPEEHVQWAIRANELVAQGEIQAPVLFCRDFSPAAQPPSLHVPWVEQESDLAFARRLLMAVRNGAPGAAFASFAFEEDQVYLASLAAVADGAPSESGQALVKALNPQLR
jgi:urocanate hydratase